MLLPDKHITIAQSVLGVSALVLNTLDKSMTLDDLMNRLDVEFDTPYWPAFHNAESVCLALTFLYALGLVDVSKEGEVQRCD